MTRPAQPPPQLKTLRERLGAMRHVGPLFVLVWRTNRWLTLGTMVVRALRALVPVITLYLGKLIVDEVIALAANPGGLSTLTDWWSSGRLDTLAWLVAAEFALAVGSDLLGRLGGVFDMMLSAEVSIATSVRLMRHAATLDLAQFEDSDVQDRLERARQQAASGLGVMGQVFGQVQSLITILSLAVGLAVYAPWLIALLLLALIPAFVGEAHFNAKDYELQWSRAEERRQLQYLRFTGASVDTAKEVKIFGLNGFLADRFEALSLGFYRARRALAVQRAGWMAALTAVGIAGYYAAYGFITWRTLAGQFSIGDLTFLAGSFRRLSGLLESLLVGFSYTANQALYLDDLFSFFRIEASIRSPAEARRVPRPLVRGIEFRDVGFRYPGTERWAVRHVSFTIAPGETIALVGENGAGKTTVVKLLARLYDPDEGQIRLDGHDLREFDLDEVRANIGVIFQDFVRYSLTAGENIAVGQIDAQHDRARIVDAAERSLASTVIAKLPAGYDQLVGKRFRTGVDLSGGEWQKVAIARAYLREAQLLILDEPTAALDARAEFEVFERFNELRAGRSSVLISHRFSSVRMADRIVVLANGTIDAIGSHDELVAQDGRYAELFELQAAGYR